MEGDDRPFKEFSEQVLDTIAKLHYALEEDRKASKARCEHLKERVKRLEREMVSLRELIESRYRP